MAEYKKSRGRKVRGFRHWCGVDVEEFAKLLVTSPRLIRNVECGRVNCPRALVSRLKKLADRIKVKRLHDATAALGGVS